MPLGVPLGPPNEVTTAVKLPREVGSVVNLTTMEVPPEFTESTIPTAPLFNNTVFPLAVGLKPVPVMLSVGALMARLALLNETVGALTMLATCCGEPLLTPKHVATAFNVPSCKLDCEANVNVNWLELLTTTVPVTVVIGLVPWVRAMVVPLVSKPVPLMVSVVALMARLSVFNVMNGGLTMVATC